MLRISTVQLQRFSASREEDFIDELLAHAAEFFPEHLQIMTPEDLRRTAARVISSGRRHRLVTRRALYLYFNCVLLLGSGVLSDAWYPWAGSLLRSHRDPEDGIEAVSDKVNAFFDEACGPRHIHLFSTGRRLAENGPALLEELRQCSMDAFPGLFSAFFPSKAAAMGEIDLRQGLRAARLQAAAHGLSSDSDALPYIFTTLILGSGLATDPQFPFAGAVLNDKSLRPGQKAERLLSGLSNVGKGFSQYSPKTSASHVQ